MNWKQVIALVASIGTIASPIDLIPDAIPVLGLTDDVAAVILAGFTLYKAVQTMRDKRAAKGAGGTKGAGQSSAGQSSAGQPSAGQPSAGQPSPGQPSSGQPSAGGTTTGTPGTFGKGAKIITDPGEPPGGGRRRR